MTEFTNKTPPNQIDPRERARRLSAVFKLILSWPPPEQRSGAPDDLGQEMRIAGTWTDHSSTDESAKLDLP